MALWQKIHKHFLFKKMGRFQPGMKYNRFYIHLLEWLIDWFIASLSSFRIPVWRWLSGKTLQGHSSTHTHTPASLGLSSILTDLVVFMQVRTGYDGLGGRTKFIQPVSFSRTTDFVCSELFVCNDLYIETGVHLGVWLSCDTKPVLTVFQASWGVIDCVYTHIHTHYRPDVWTNSQTCITRKRDWLNPRKF